MKAFDAAHFDREQCKPFLHRGGEKGLLLLHGFTGSVAHMRPLGDALADRGHTVLASNLPGHATTEADMARTNDRMWLAAARDATIALRSYASSVTVVGLSMGGLIALKLAAEGMADGCVTLSAPLPTNNRFAGLAGVLAPLWPRIGKAPGEERRLMVDPAFDYGYAGFPTKKTADLQRLIHAAKRCLPQVTCPLLVVQSTGDRTVRASSADTIMRLAGSAQKSKLELEGVHHVCTLTPALPVIVQAVDAFVQAL